MIGDQYYMYMNTDVCRGCLNNPINGGNGFCNCTLPYTTFTTPIYQYKKPEPIQPFIGGTFRVIDDEFFEIVDGVPPNSDEFIDGDGI